jgi:hypothetical protein
MNCGVRNFGDTPFEALVIGYLDAAAERVFSGRLQEISSWVRQMRHTPGDHHICAFHCPFLDRLACLGAAEEMGRVRWASHSHAHSLRQSDQRPPESMLRQHHGSLHATCARRTCTVLASRGKRHNG